MVDPRTEEERQRVTVELMKDVKAIYVDGAGISVEYWVMNFWISNGWAVAMYVFVGKEMKTYTFYDPTNDIGAELKIEPAALLRANSDKTVTLECPLQAEIGIRDIRLK